MISIVKATENDHAAIVHIGKISVEEAHRGSCAAEELNEYLDNNYNTEKIKEELGDKNNIYHIIFYNNVPAGFSKIILNAAHPNIISESATKLDRIYLLKEFHSTGLGYGLLKFNIDLARKNKQSGTWLFTWVGNKRAVDFYLKAGFAIVGSHQFKVTETRYNENHQMLYDLSGEQN